MTIKKVMCVLLLICFILICGCSSEPGTKTQFSDNIHGIVIDKRVDTWGQATKAIDYVLIMQNNNGYYEAVVSFQKYASVKIGDKL